MMYDWYLPRWLLVPMARAVAQMVADGAAAADALMTMAWGHCSTSHTTGRVGCKSAGHTWAAVRGRRLPEPGRKDFSSSL